MSSSYGNDTSIWGILILAIIILVVLTLFFTFVPVGLWVQLISQG